MPDAEPLPHGPHVALGGLRSANGRLREAITGFLTGGGGSPVSTALTEALYWIATLDEHASDVIPDYWTIRARDRGGRAVGGLVYARNRHTHELVSASEAVFEAGQVGIIVGGKQIQEARGPWLSIQLRWRPLHELPPAGRTEDHDRDVMYADAVAERPVSHPVDDAVQWLSALLDREEPGAT